MKASGFLKRDHRVFGLDILRACAILFVLIEHSGAFLPESIRHFTNFLVFDGVTIFFVLSGFLVGRILIKSFENGFNYKQFISFLLRRWFRTLPAYYIVICLLIVFRCFSDSAFVPESVYRYFLFLQNFSWEHPYHFFPEAWSLSIEEWFYFLFPACLFLLVCIFKTKDKRIIPMLAFILIIAVTMFRIFRFSQVEIYDVNAWNQLFRKQVITRVDSIMYGIIGAYISMYYSRLWNSAKRSLFFLGIILFFAIKFIVPVEQNPGGLFSSVFSFSVISLATLLLLPLLSSIKEHNRGFLNAITFISITSYAMYLLNLSVISGVIIPSLRLELIIKNTLWLSLFQYSLFWVLVFVISFLFYKYIENPLTQIRENKFFKTFSG